MVGGLFLTQRYNGIHTHRVSMAEKKGTIMAEKKVPAQWLHYGVIQTRANQTRAKR